MTAPTPVPRPAPTNGARPTAQPSAPPAKASRLGSIKRGQLRSPLRCLFYGPEGVGKSSLAADAPSPVFLDIEGGADNIDAARYPFRDEVGGHVPRSYADVLAAIDDLAANAHEFRTVVIDTIDALEALIHRHICALHGEASVESFGYGKGHVIALDVFRELVTRLDGLRAKGIQVVILGHSIVKTFKNPLGEDFDRYQLRVHDKAGGLLKEWCDVVGFIRFDEGSSKLKGDTSQTKRARGYATGRRIVHLAREAAWDAKSRLALPAELELGEEHPWGPFAEVQADARDTSDDEIRAEIEVELARLGDEFTDAKGNAKSSAKIRAGIATADRSILTRTLSGLRATATPTASQES